MRNRKVKIPQYLVRGKRREFHVLVFPRLKHTWAYYDSDSEHYAIDADIVGCKWLRFAMASLIAAPDKIVYFPIRTKTSFHGYYFPNYDTVLTRPELQLRRSEWVRLRRQLTPAHQINQFVLRYEPDKLCDYVEKFDVEQQRSYRRKHSSCQEIYTLLGDTVFMPLMKDSCYLFHQDILDTAWQNDENYGSSINWDFGWFLPDGAIHNMAAHETKTQP